MTKTEFPHNRWKEDRDTFVDFYLFILDIIIHQAVMIIFVAKASSIFLINFLRTNFQEVEIKEARILLKGSLYILPNCSLDWLSNLSTTSNTR